MNVFQHKLFYPIPATRVGQRLQATKNKTIVCQKKLQLGLASTSDEA